MVLNNNIQYCLSRIGVLIACIFFLSYAKVYPQISKEDTSINLNSFNERGLLRIRNYTTHEYDARAQNWAIVQDKRGVMYFGNNDGILEYDGFEWRKIILPSECDVRSLCINEDGVIFVGGVDDIGYLRPNLTGQLGFVSLLNNLDQSDKDFGEIWTCYSTPEGIYFQTSKRIFRWDGKDFKVWVLNSSNSEDRFHKMFYINNTVYVRHRGEGMKKIFDDRLVMIQGGELFKDQDVYFMIPYDSNKILMNTTDHGLYIMDPTPIDYFPKDRLNPKYVNVITPFRTEADQFFIDNKVYNCVLLGNNIFAVGTEGTGMIIIDGEGKVLHHLNKMTGLQDASIYYQYLDVQNNLWLALGNGIAKVAEINSPITYFDDRLGLEGTIQSAVRHNGILYVATLSGTYYLENNETSNFNVTENNFTKIKNFMPSGFKRIPEINSQCWDFVSIENEETTSLLVASNKGIYQIDEHQNASIIAVYDLWRMCHSDADPNRVFVGATDGIGSLYFLDGNWIDEGHILGISEDIHKICEDKDGHLWLTAYGKLFEVIITGVNDSKYWDKIDIILHDSLHGLPKVLAYGYNVNNKIIFASNEGVYEYKEGRFVRSGDLGGRFLDNTHIIHRFSEDYIGNYWMETIDRDDFSYEIGYVQSDSSDSNGWMSTPFNLISDDIVHSIYHDFGGITWLGGSGGMYRYDMSKSKSYSNTYTCLIRKVIIGKDSLAFGGTFYNEDSILINNQPDYFIPILGHKNNSLTFLYAAPSFEDDASLVYRFYLEGFNNGWTDWDKETKANYTNLSEGDYKFRVKAKNIYNNESLETVFSFTILPPWYRTIWAYIGYMMAFVSFVYISIIISTRSLQRIIKQKTAEVVKQKDEIEMKNKDITDSINYAQKIQEAILPSETDIALHLPNNFILFKPKDIVSGDFYWFSKKEEKAFIAAADCTGHGVPGAFMSMIGNSLLNEIVNDNGVNEPAKILQELKEGVIKSLKQTGEAGKQKDGMDIALCAFDFKNNILEFSGAYNPLIRIRDGILEETRSDRMPIGIYSDDGGKVFTNHKFEMEKGDVYYFYTDGFVDQFGGPKGKKYMGKRFKKLLLEIHGQPMTKQKEKLNEVVEGWKAYESKDGGVYEQMDDILVIGVKV